MGLEIVEAPESLPVSAAEMVEHMRLPTADEDLSPFIAAAADLIELETRRQLVAATYRLHLPRFPACEREIRLPKPPLESVESVTYIDGQGQQQTLSENDYRIDQYSTPARLVLRNGSAWPATDDVAGAVIVTFTAGYGEPEDVPALLRQCIKLIAAHLYENREAATDRTITTVPLAAETIMQRYQVMELV